MTRSRLAGWASSAALLFGSTVAAVLLAEGGLRVAVNPSDFLQATLVEDPVLGQRIMPGTTGHDALGFRNASVPAQSRVVALGDSNTYGVSAPREGSWPHQLSGLLGEPVYNMGLGGFGPLQYLHLAQHQARDLKPQVLLVGFYFGNDLMDAYHIAYGRTHWQSWKDASASAPASAASTAGTPAVAQEPAKRFAGLRDWLARHSVLYSVLRATVFQRLAAQERESQVQRSSPDVRWAWSDPAQPDLRTVFTPQLRLLAQDPALSAPAEGLRIAKRALVALHEGAKQNGQNVLVVLIPTKERTYCAYVQSTSAASSPAAFNKLCEVEARVKADVVRHLTDSGVAFVDPTPALEAKVAAHTALYPADSDGHLQSAGYGVVAQVVAQTLQTKQWATKP